MRAPPMTMLKKAMVIASKKRLNSSSGWGMVGSAWAKLPIHIKDRRVMKIVVSRNLIR